jgi:drug/metabolite transporter (DMT)-like permease
MAIYVIAFICVLGLAIGQILFKASATALTQTGSFFAPKTAMTFFAAMCLYGVTSIVWVWLLQKMELGRLYPFMALAFVMVPIGSYLFLGEKFSPQYFIGVALIVAGIIVIVRA